MRVCQGGLLLVVGVALLLGGEAHGGPGAAGGEVAGKKGVAPEIVVRHPGYRVNGWDVAETPHFRIYHGQPEELIERVGPVVEKARAAQLRKWFGAADEDWDQRCELYIYADARQYSAATGAAQQSPGHSVIKLDAGRVLCRQIHVHADDPGMIAAVLPHEVTHTVLAGHFGGGAVPKWADEGMAVLGEPRERIERHLRNLPGHLHDGELQSARQLVEQRDYPEPRHVGAFYAQSVSLVDFLARAKGPRTFARFLRAGIRSGYAGALREHYGWDFDELERRWRQEALGE